MGPDRLERGSTTASLHLLRACANDLGTAIYIAPEPRKTAGMVWANIFTSSQKVR